MLGVLRRSWDLMGPAFLVSVSGGGEMHQIEGWDSGVTPTE